MDTKSTNRTIKIWASKARSSAKHLESAELSSNLRSKQDWVKKFGSTEPRKVRDCGVAEKKEVRVRVDLKRGRRGKKKKPFKKRSHKAKTTPFRERDFAI
ncbi:hypothetical protein COLO4_08166 [Corchorus olitorius]|uniref:Uncharacterized protein n=1 Tax=Corchorus olitorius TaxID=93759 RepID=A0A1R3KH55_9ROSI|nr:hypothetical protein COLO4_08166 [Corchorus olitorius]